MVDRRGWVMLPGDVVLVTFDDTKPAVGPVVVSEEEAAMYPIDPSMYDSRVSVPRQALNEALSQARGLPCTTRKCPTGDPFWAHCQPCDRCQHVAALERLVNNARGV